MKKIITALLVVISTSASAQIGYKPMNGYYQWNGNLRYMDTLFLDSADYNATSGLFLGYDTTGASTTGYYQVTQRSAPSGTGSTNKVAIWSSAAVLTNAAVDLTNTGGNSHFLAPIDEGMDFTVDGVDTRLTLDTGRTVFNIIQPTAKDITFLSATDTMMQFDVSTDRVGILNSAPEYVLDVKGAIRSGKNGTDGQFRIYSEQGATDYSVILRPAEIMIENTTYNLPPDNGDANEVLQTDGNGLLTWEADDNGIYTGNGSLSGNTVVTQSTNTLAFTAGAVNGFSVDGSTFSVDALNNRVGIGTPAPVTPLHIIGDAGVFLTVTSALIGAPNIVSPSFATFPADASTSPVYIEVNFNGQAGYITFVPKI